MSQFLRGIFPSNLLLFHNLHLAIRHGLISMISMMLKYGGGCPWNVRRIGRQLILYIFMFGFVWGRCDEQNNLPWWLIHHYIPFLYHCIVLCFELQSPTATCLWACCSGRLIPKLTLHVPPCCSGYITFTKQFQPKKRGGLSLVFILHSTGML